MSTCCSRQRWPGHPSRPCPRPRRGPARQSSPPKPAGPGTARKSPARRASGRARTRPGSNPAHPPAPAACRPDRRCGSQPLVQPGELGANLRQRMRQLAGHLLEIPIRAEIEPRPIGGEPAGIWSIELPSTRAMQCSKKNAVVPAARAPGQRVGPVGKEMGSGKRRSNSCRMQKLSQKMSAPICSTGVPDSAGLAASDPASAASAGSPPSARQAA